MKARGVAVHAKFSLGYSGGGGGGESLLCWHEQTLGSDRVSREILLDSAGCFHAHAEMDLRDAILLNSGIQVGVSDSDELENQDLSYILQGLFGYECRPACLPLLAVLSNNGMATDNGQKALQQQTYCV